MQSRQSRYFLAQIYKVKANSVKSHEYVKAETKDPGRHLTLVLTGKGLVHDGICIFHQDGCCRKVGFLKKKEYKVKKTKEKGERKSHLDTISFCKTKHLRHSSWHTSLQGSKVMMTNE